LAQHIDTGCIVAIKRVHKQVLVQYNMVDRFIEEIKLHKSLNHPNIVKFYGFFEEQDHICLVLEYLSGGTLFDYLN
jgi:aurora kinase, other